MAQTMQSDLVLSGDVLEELGVSLGLIDEHKECRARIGHAQRLEECRSGVGARTIIECQRDSPLSRLRRPDGGPKELKSRLRRAQDNAEEQYGSRHNPRIYSQLWRDKRYGQRHDWAQDSDGYNPLHKAQ